MGPSISRRVSGVFRGWRNRFRRSLRWGFQTAEYAKHARLSRMKAFPILAIALASSSVCAFRLSGTILQEGTRLPLANALVELVGRSDIAAATTDSAGRFLLLDGTTRVAVGEPKVLRGRMEHGAFVVRGASWEPAMLEALSPEGKLLASLDAVPQASGELRFPNPLAGVRGMAILRFRQGPAIAVWTSLSLSTTGTVIAATGRGFGARALLDAAVDTLLVSKAGMKDIRVALPSGAGTTLASLDAPVAMASTTRGRQRFIPEGRFLMGDTAFPASRPAIRRTVKAFWIDTVLATRDELRALGFPQIVENGTVPGEGNWMRAVRYCNLRSTAENLPLAYELTADSASWSVKPDAEGYRLPTEAEWEYAARAGTTTPWYWGDDSSVAKVSLYAAYTRSTRGNPIPVGSLLPNGFGLYDMSGNSWEWTEDMFGYYERDDVQPVPVRGTYGYERVMRGGMWASSSQELRSGYRKKDLPLASPYIGVRCVRTAR